MKWVEPQPVDVPPGLQEAAGGNRLLAEALLLRGVDTPSSALAFLDPSHYRPSPPDDLPDLPIAVDRLEKATRKGEAILVWGDFDVDGLTATALLVEALTELGAHAEWHIPDRQTESHGVHWRSLQPFLGRGVRVLLTCDTGVSAHETVSLAAGMGLDVIITDHHALPPTLPQALAVVNPNRLAEEHPLRFLSGAAVAYKLAEALGVSDRGLDLVALGLVADVVPQRGDVRYLLQRGLDALRGTKRVGLLALLEMAELSPATLDEDDISFALAPRLNALGRLADASAGVKLFLTQDLVLSRTIAAEMEALNVRRQFLSRQVTAGAREQLSRDPGSDSLPVWVLSHQKWPGGVLGVAAGRLAEQYSRPVVLIATPPGEVARGSARSVPGVDMYTALARHSDLLVSFGGHPMAAGFSIYPDRIAQFRRALIETVGGWVGERPLEREVPIQAYLRFDDLSLELVDELARLAPFGPGNPPVVFATCQLEIAQTRAIGRTAEHLQADLRDGDGNTQRALWWYGAEAELPEGLFDLAYVLRADEFRGQRSLHLEWVDARSLGTQAVQPAMPAVVPDVADYRTLSDPYVALATLWDPNSTQLYAEAVAVAGYKGRTRLELEPGKALVVWTLPPSASIWWHLLETVRPDEVYLFGVNPQLDSLTAFLTRLGGLVKHALTYCQGRLRWDALAAAMAHREETIRAGVAWLAARGQISRLSAQHDLAVVAAGGSRDDRTEREIQQELGELLRETAAYRTFFREAGAKQLVVSAR